MPLYQVRSLVLGPQRRYPLVENSNRIYLAVRLLGTSLTKRGRSAAVDDGDLMLRRQITADDAAMLLQLVPRLHSRDRKYPAAAGRQRTECTAWRETDETGQRRRRRCGRWDRDMELRREREPAQRHDEVTS